MLTELSRPITGGRSRYLFQLIGSSMNAFNVCSLRVIAVTCPLTSEQVEFDPGCEAMVFSIDGTPLQGITGGYGGDRRVDHIIPKHAVKEGHYEIVI